MFTSFYHCRCYYTHNIYVKKLNKHFVFINESQFFKDYEEFLNTLRFNEVEKNAVVLEIIAEIDRRKQLQEKTIERKTDIKNNYVPLVNRVYRLEEEFLEPSFIKLVEAAKIFDYQEIFKTLNNLSVDKKIYSFPVFKYDFCNMLLKEFLHFEESHFAKERPNTMNNNGILIDDIGFHDNFSATLRTKYLDPLARALFPECRGQGLDSHKIFTVEYKVEQDTELGYHYDNSEVTLNICLGQRFEGGELYFGDMNTTPNSKSSCILVSHKIGHGMLHRGQQYHGALPVTFGVRQNLIMWMRSSNVRNSQCPRCYSKPSLVSSLDYGDGFTKLQEIALI